MDNLRHPMKAKIKAYEEYKKDFSKDLAFILGRLESYYPQFSDRQRKKLQDVFWFGEEAHRDQKRFSGEPYYIHPVAATKVLLTIQPDIDTICACLLHDVIEDTDYTAQDIEVKFGADIAFLCEGVEKVAKVRLQGKEREFESLRKLFIAMAKDIRVIFIKLADRIHNLETLDFVREEKRVRIARESMQIYAPVAEKLGLFEFKIRIEDTCFKNIHPDYYRDINRQIGQSMPSRKAFVDKAKSEIVNALDQEHLEVLNIEGRPKNVHSVYEKMKRKNFSTAAEIYDLFAIRIIVPKVTDCYRVLGVLHASWKPMANRFKDYIAVPKPNGYQSLHTTLLGLAKSDLPTEIQIRTEQMHMDAEYGPAAHWAYKKAKTSNFDEAYVSTTSWFPDHLRSGEESSAEEFFEEISNSLTIDRIHAFTPRGDVKDLPKGATPVDFAFAIHSEVGESCIGAKVNGVIKPLHYELKTGDIVEVQTKEGRQPNPVWLDFVKSSHARNHIKAFINKQKKEGDVPSESLKIKPVIKKAPKNRAKGSIKPKQNMPRIVVGGEEDIPYRIATCCKPVPGKDIFAYSSRGLEFVVHEVGCQITRDMESERFLEAHFRIEHAFYVKATDRVGLLRDFTNLIADHGLNITDSEFFFQKDKRIAHWKFIIECSSDRELKEISDGMKKVPNVFFFEEVNLDKNIRHGLE